MAPPMRSLSAPFLTILMLTVLADVKLFTNAQLTRAHNNSQAFVDAHNAARRQVGVRPLGWSPTLARYALSYAQSQVGHCLPLTHSHGPYGENLFWGMGKTWTPQDAVASWVGEINNYDYTTNTCAAGKMCGHYTLVVWAATTSMGCASVLCVGGANYIICSYNPPGNWIGERPY